MNKNFKMESQVLFLHKFYQLYNDNNYKNKPALVLSNGLSISWKEYYSKVAKFSYGLTSMNLKSDSSIAIMGFNSPEWFISAVGSLLSSLSYTGIYPTSGPDEVDHIINISNSSILVLENRKLLKQIDLKNENIKLIIIYNDFIEENIYSYENLNIPIIHFKSFGSQLNEFDDYINEIVWNTNFLSLDELKQKLACCIMTSGTTSRSKAVMLSYYNIGYTAYEMVKKYNLNNERIVSYLPLSHIAASMIDIFIHFYHGGTVYFAKPDALKGSLVDTLKVAKPTVFFGVPRVFEKMEEKMKAVAEKKYSGMVGSLLKRIMDVGKKNTLLYHQNNQNNVMNGFYIKNIKNLFSNKVFIKIKENLGLEKAKYLMTGAAPISLSTLEYFGSIDMVIFELSGMSETTGVISGSYPYNYKWGSAGKQILGEIKIAEDGEILYKGKNNMMGYKNNIEATQETFTEDGFLKTGDLGSIDDKFFLHITGRKKEMIITAGGENVAPVLIEQKIKENGPFINQVVIIGDKRKYLTALITLPCIEDSQILENKCLEIDSNCRTSIEAEKSQEWINYVQSAVNKYNDKPFSNAQKIQKFKILTTTFSINNDTMTPTMKFKRKRIEEQFNLEIESMY